VLTADARKDVKPIGTPLGIENYPGLAGAMIAFLRQDSDSANANAQRVEAGEQQQKLRRQECRSAGKPARGNTLVDGLNGRKQAGIEGQAKQATGNARLEGQRKRDARCCGY
jgi:hypothetical protein